MSEEGGMIGTGSAMRCLTTFDSVLIKIERTTDGNSMTCLLGEVIVLIFKDISDFFFLELIEDKNW